jgi:hypothetical protein
VSLRSESKTARSILISVTANLIVVCLVMMHTGCGRDNAEIPLTGTSSQSAGWVELKDRESQPTSLRISHRLFTPDATTTISFDLPEDGIVTLTLYDGESIEVARLLDRQLLDAGLQEVDFDASNLGSGVYVFTLLYQFVSPDGRPASDIFRMSKKMMLVK